MEDYRTYVTEDATRLAMAKGFEPLLFHYEDSLFNYYGQFPNFGDVQKNEYYLNPTAEQVINWLRIKHGIIVSMGAGYHYKGTAYYDNGREYGREYHSNDYDEMVNGVLKVALEMIKG